MNTTNTMLVVAALALVALAAVPAASAMEAKADQTNMKVCVPTTSICAYKQCITATSICVFCDPVSEPCTIRAD